ncbi:MAG: D-alanine--D-alanine ligase family protein [Bacillota bacterium]|nr:D-alanine--D-alanine ligase family protein [Bacillota bacterium]
MKLGIIFGGRSGEHEVSLMSAASVIGAVDKSKYQVVQIGITRGGEWLLYDGPPARIESGEWEREARAALAAEPEKYGFTVLGTGGRNLKELVDFAFPVLHGPYGEDGTIQGLFEMAGIPYAGSGVTGSAAAMDKILAKAIFAREGLPQCEYLSLQAEELEEDIAEDRRLPLPGRWEEKGLSPRWFVKPANMGSSVGISRATDRDSMAAALKEAARFDSRILIEEGIDGRELEVAILGNHNPQAAEVGEIIPSAAFYDYHAKYLDGGRSRLCIPAEISRETAERLKDIALRAYKALDCCGYARVDFFLERGTDQLYLNEVNTIPGFTRFSMFPLLWGAAGVPYPELIERIVELGYERYHAKNHR